MKHYRAYCFDLDGTVYRGKEGIQSAVELINELQAKQIDYFLVTNNSSKTPLQLQEALEHIGLNVPTKRIYSSALATAKYISQHFKGCKIQMIGSDGLYYALQQEGIFISEDEDADVVVMGIDRNVNYMKLAKACVAVENGAKLIGTNEDIKFPSELGFLPGNGSFVRLVANVASTEPVFIGKPSPVMLEVIQTEYDFSKEEMVMIGDNYDTDILCGIRFGCDTIHVNTGVTSTQVVKQKDVQPTYCVNDLSQFPI